MSGLICTGGYVTQALPPGEIQLSVVDVAAVEPDALDAVFDQVLAGHRLVDRPEQAHHRFTTVSFLALAGATLACWLIALLTWMFLSGGDTSSAADLFRASTLAWTEAIAGTGVLIAGATQGWFDRREVLTHRIDAPASLEVTITTTDQPVFRQWTRLQHLWKSVNDIEEGMVPAAELSRIRHLAYQTQTHLALAVAATRADLATEASCQLHNAEQGLVRLERAENTLTAAAHQVELERRHTQQLNTLRRMRVAETAGTVAIAAEPAGFIAEPGEEPEGLVGPQTPGAQWERYS